MSVTNANAFAALDYVFLGEVGFEQCELMQVQAVNTTTQTVTFTGNTLFPHAESARIAVTPFDKVRFFWTSVATYDTLNPLSGYIPLQPDGWFTKYVDNTQSTGFGWFIYQNSTTGNVSGPSNAIPYANFARATVKMALDGFFSLIHNNESKLITYDDALEWLNEANDIAKNDLALSNNEYDTSDGSDTLSIVAGTQEYALPANFGEMITVWINTTPGVSTGEILFPIDLANVDRNNIVALGERPRFYIRGGYIGFTPTPIQNFTVYFRYSKCATDLVSYTDVIDLPRKAFHALKDYMLYRAKTKLRHVDGQIYLASFQKKIDMMRLQAINRDSSVDSFDIKHSSNV